MSYPGTAFGAPSATPTPCHHRAPPTGRHSGVPRIPSGQGALRQNPLTSAPLCFAHPAATPVSSLAGRIGACSMLHTSHRPGSHPTTLVPRTYKRPLHLVYTPLSAEGAFPGKHHCLPCFLPLSWRRRRPPSPATISLLEQPQEHPGGMAQLTGAAAPPSLHQRVISVLMHRRRTVHAMSRWPTPSRPPLLVASPAIHPPSPPRLPRSNCSCHHRSSSPKHHLTPVALLVAT
jgi:hypothetical protein